MLSPTQPEERLLRPHRLHPQHLREQPRQHHLHRRHAAPAPTPPPHRNPAPATPADPPSHSPSPATAPPPPPPPAPCTPATAPPRTARNPPHHLHPRLRHHIPHQPLPPADPRAPPPPPAPPPDAPPTPPPPHPARSGTPATSPEITAPQILQLPLRSPPHQIPRPIHPLPHPPNGSATNRSAVNPARPRYPRANPAPATYNSPTTPTGTGRNRASNTRDTACRQYRRPIGMRSRAALHGVAEGGVHTDLGDAVHVDHVRVRCAVPRPPVVRRPVRASPATARTMPQRIETGVRGRGRPARRGLARRA